ncbi:MAG: fatty acid CoA ligase family protein [Polyangiales bacterium]
MNAVEPSVNASADQHVVRHLRAQVALTPDRPALISPVRREGPWPIPFTERTYADVDARSDALAHGFTDIGIGMGTKTILMLRTSDELFVVLLALYKVGAVPVVLDPGMGFARMLHCYRSVGAEAFIGIPLSHVIRRARPKFFASVRITVSDGAFGEHRLADLYRTGRGPFVLPPVTPDTLLMLVFTTGSTGPAKGVEYTHAMLDALVGQVRSTYPLDDGERGLVTLSLFALVDLFTGCTAVLAPMDPTRPADVDPNVILGTLEQYEVRHMFGSPALLRRIAPALTARATPLPNLRTVVCGGAAAPLPLLQQVRGALEGDPTVHATYGATEALPIATIDLRALEDGCDERTRHGAGVCMGPPIDGMQARMLRITREPIPTWDDTLVEPDGTPGEITLCGPVVSKRYHNAPEHDALHKIADGPRTWHRTGDVGWLDERGRIWMCGRKAQTVTTAEGPRFTMMCEAVFNTHPAVQRSALVGVGPDGAQLPVVCVELTPEAAAEGTPATLFEELRTLAEAHECTRGLTRYIVHPRFPVDVRHNAKIGREELAVWAGAKLGLLRMPPAFHVLMVIPLLGWLYQLLPLVWPFPHPALWALWWVVMFLHFVVHPLQIIPGLPVARRVGHGTLYIACMTTIFGATYWRPLAGVSAKELAK